MLHENSTHADTAKMSAFSRRLIDRESLVIESTCDYCGFHIVGIAFERLEKAEAEHRGQCSRPRHQAARTAA